MSGECFSFGEADFQPMSSFRYRWRWLKPEHDLMAADELARIRPLAPHAADSAWRFSLQWHPRDVFDASPSLTVFPAAESLDDPHSCDASKWLRARLPSARTPVVISWQPDVAVLTDSQLFVARWDAFCYPASDDVDIWPLDSRWVVTYWHEEKLWHGRRAGQRAV